MTVIDTDKLRRIAKAAQAGPSGRDDVVHVDTFEPTMVLAMLDEIDRLRDTVRRSPAGRDDNPNTGHGHVLPRPDRVVFRCGGPRMCPKCAADLASTT